MSKLYWLAFISVPGIGGAMARRLLERFGSVQTAYEAPDEELLRIPRLTAEMVHRLRATSLPALERELAELSLEGVQALPWDADDYPANLRSLSDAPPLLFVRGEILARDAQAVAIAGTREPGPQGLAAAELLARELAARGLTVVSGLAIGIDTAAHRGALQAEGGRTLAVLGSGLRAIHPRRNLPLAQEIAQRGALLSELAPAAPVCGPNLMARDRITSGLGRALIVVEAGEKSGTMDTAIKARRQGRALYAVPGSPGTEALLAEGAERLDPMTADWDALAARICADEAGGGAAQLSLWGSNL